LKIFYQAQHDWYLRIQGKACLEVIHFLDSSFNQSIDSNTHWKPKNCLHYLYPDPVVIRRSADSLERLGFRKFPRALVFVNNPLQVYGQINSPSTKILPRNGSLKMTGWANVLSLHQLPELVLLSYGNQKTFFKSTVLNLNKSRNKALWEAEILSRSLPLGETVIKAWVYDQKNKQFVQLNGETKVTILSQ